MRNHGLSSAMGDKIWWFPAVGMVKPLLGNPFLTELVGTFYQKHQLIVTLAKPG